MVTFRLAKNEDLNELKRTLLDSFVKQSQIDYGRDDLLPPGVNDGSQIDKAMVEDYDLYTIDVNNKVAGGIIVQEKEDKEYYLQTLWLDVNFQNQKIGHQAMAFIEEKYSDAQSWVLETPSEALRNRHFYEKHGYKKVKELEFEGSDIVLIIYRKLM